MRRIIVNHVLRIALWTASLAFAVYMLGIGTMGGEVLVHTITQSMASRGPTGLTAADAHIGFLIGGFPCVMFYIMAMKGILGRFSAKFPV
jgi:hypothetical protein